MTTDGPGTDPQRTARPRSRTAGAPPSPPLVEPPAPPDAGRPLPEEGQPPAGGGRGANRRTLSIEARRRRVAELLLAGYSQREIVEALDAVNADPATRGPLYPGVSKSNIARDSLALSKEWREGAAQDVASAKEIHLAQVDADIQTWRRRLILGEGTPPRAYSTEDQVRIHSQILLPLMKHRAEILGLKAPTRFEISDYVKRWAREAGYPEGRALEIANEVAAAAWEEG